jgi:hypothetical protein
MPHALINCKTNVGAEADLWLPTLSASALSTRVRSEQLVRIRRSTGPGASPLPGRNENRTKQTHIVIASVSVGGGR